LGEANLEINPIDITETFATKMDLNFSRVDDNEISILLKEDYPQYVLSVVLKADCEIMCFSCDIGLSVPGNRRLAVVDAMAKANERIWVGHFDLISTDSRIVYSLTIPFVSSFLMDEEMLESMVQLITDECNRFYHYFAIMIESKKCPDITLGALFLEEAGEA
jgi:hypothetical protein